MIPPLRVLRTSVLLLALLAAGTTAKSASAQPSDQGAAADRAASLYRQGNAAFEQKKWPEAEAAYLEAWRLARTFDVASNLGEVELKLGKPREAAVFLAFSLRNAPPSAKAAQRERTRHFLDEATQKIATLRVSANVSSATLTVDGAPVAPEEMGPELFVSPGTHVLAAKADGYVEARTTVEAAAGSSQDVTLTLAPVPPPRRSVVPGVVMGSVAGAALVTGLGLFAGGRAKLSTAHDMNAAILGAGHSCVTTAANYDPTCADLYSTASTSNTLQKAGVGLMVGAGAAAVGTVIYFVLRPTGAKPSSTGTLLVTPTLSPGAAGLVFSGAF